MGGSIGLQHATVGRVDARQWYSKSLKMGKDQQLGQRTAARLKSEAALSRKRQGQDSGNYLEILRCGSRTRRVAVRARVAMRRTIDGGSGTAVGVSSTMSIWSGMLRLMVVGLLNVALGF